jgi:hypothetical protein
MARETRHHKKLDLPIGSSGSLRPALEWNCSDDHLVVDGSQSSANEGADPEDPL